MPLTVEQVEQIAKLARLSLTEEDKQLYTQSLSMILEYVEKLKELDTSDIEPLTHILPDFNVFRADEVKVTATREELLANAPLLEEEQFKVPKII